MIEASPTPSADDLDQAVAVLQRGGVVAFPTETYYGLAVDPFNRQAVTRLFAVKRRPVAKPILVLIADRGQLDRMAAEIPPQFFPLMDAFWPGPLTLIFPAAAALSIHLTAGTGTIGIRISSHPLAQRLCALAGGVITATSANRAGAPPARTAEDVIAQFGGDLDWVVRGGETQGGPASTILALAADGGISPVREGAIPFAAALQCLPG